MPSGNSLPGRVCLSSNLASTLTLAVQIYFSRRILHVCFRSDSVCLSSLFVIVSLKRLIFFFFLEKCRTATSFPHEPLWLLLLLHNKSALSTKGTFLQWLCSSLSRFITIKTDIFLSVCKGNKYMDVFGKSTVGLPVFLCPSVSFLQTKSNGNYWRSVPSFCWFELYLFGRMTVPLPESCCCFSLWELRVWWGAELV